MRLLGFKQLVELFPVSRPTIGRLEQRSSNPFPMRVWIGGRCFWYYDPVVEWIARNAKAR